MNNTHSVFEYLLIKEKIFRDEAIELGFWNHLCELKKAGVVTQRIDRMDRGRRYYLVNPSVRKAYDSHLSFEVHTFANLFTR